MSVSPFASVFAPGGAAAAKPPFDSLPPALRRDLITLAAASGICDATIAPGGVSAAASYLVSFDNGARLFVKGSHPGDQSHGAANLRSECAAYQTLPILRDVAPAYRGMVFADDGDDQGWWLGAWDALDVQTSQPDAAAAFDLLRVVQLADVPPAADIPMATAHPYLAQFFNDVYKWRRLADDAARAEKFAACFADAAAAHDWLQKSLPPLLALQAQAAMQPFRLGLMHGDLRCDNLLYAAIPGRPPRWWMIDWANAAEGPLVFDRVMLAASLLAAGACDTATAARAAQGDHAAADYQVMLATMAGYFADQLYRAPPAALPRLRPLQKAMFWALATLLTEARITPALPDFHSV